MPELSPREAEVLHLIIEGKSDWEIGAILSVAPRTVNFHAENLKRKLGASNRLQAVLKAVRSGLIPL
jgi:LuxR family transcriptional regulator/LuxR family quorum sensing-dependent transcriptional regulator